MLTLRSRRFGELTYADENIITLAEGLVGLPRLRRWILLDMDRPLPLKWLQSLDDADFAVPVAEPALFAEAYNPDPSAQVIAQLDVCDCKELAIMIITTVHAGGKRLTGNLAAPLLVHPGTRYGVQAVLEDGKWPLQQEIDYARFNLAAQVAMSGGDVSAPSGGPDLLDAVQPRATSGEDLARQEVTL